MPFFSCLPFSSKVAAWILSQTSRYERSIMSPVDLCQSLAVLSLLMLNSTRLFGNLRPQTYSYMPITRSQTQVPSKGLDELLEVGVEVVVASSLHRCVWPLFPGTQVFSKWLFSKRFLPKCDLSGNTCCASSKLAPTPNPCSVHGFSDSKTSC